MASQLIHVTCYAMKHKRGCHFQHPQTTYFYRSEISLLIKGIIKKEMRVSYSWLIPHTGAQARPSSEDKQCQCPGR